MDENVSQKAAEQGREQEPMLSGDPDRVLITMIKCVLAYVFLFFIAKCC